MAVGVGLVASAAGTLLKSAKKFLQKRAGKLAAKAVQVRSAANMKAGKIQEASSLLNKLSGADIGEVSSNPIKNSEKMLSAQNPDIAKKAERDGIVLGGKKQGINIGLIIALVVGAFFLIPAISKRR